MKVFLGTISFLLVIAYALGDIQKKDEVTGVADRDGKAVKIVGFYSQTTLLSLVTATVSSIYTCMSTSVKVCLGRRRRRALIKSFNEDISDDGILDGSSNIDSTMESFVQPFEKIDQRTGRRVTVWSTLYSTLSIFTTLPIIGSTVTVSALCNQIGNSVILPSCFLG